MMNTETMEKDLLRRMADVHPADDGLTCDELRKLYDMAQTGPDGVLAALGEAYCIGYKAARVRYRNRPNEVIVR